jgi:hypothetical protein
MPGARPYTIDGVLQNQLSNLVPLRRTNQQVYQLGQKRQFGLDGYCPMWEVVSFQIPPLGTKDARVNVQRDFHLLGMVGSSSTVNGFRVQLFDMRKRRRFSDRAFGHFQLLGGQGSILFLRRPYRFDEPDSQILVQVQNLDNVTHNDQIVLYGVVLRFNDPKPWKWGRPGHGFLKRFLDINLGWPWFDKSKGTKYDTMREN